MRLLSLLCLSIFSFFSCKTTSYTPSDYPEAQITFGSGGGFTGMKTDFTLLENGQFFKKGSNEKEFTALSKVGKNQTRQIFENLKVLNLQGIKFNEPGNMNTYLKIKTAEGSNDITWGVPGPPPPDNAKLFYSILMNLVKKN